MLIFFKLAWGYIWQGLKEIVAFTIAHWRIILPMLVLGYCLHLYFKQVKRADTAEQALASYIKQANAEKLAREILNIKEYGRFTAKLAESEAKAKAVEQKYKLDRARETKNLKDYYENRLGVTTRNWSERLRLDQTANNTGLPESASDTQGLAESGRNCDGAITALERACQLTTNDYNRLRAWGDEVCKSVVCE